MREYLAEAGPTNPREFIFSPEVGKSIGGPGVTHAVEAEEVDKIQRFGRGALTIIEFKLQPTANGCPVIEWMQFSVRLEGGY
jgi:metal-sulfur cluster biosynthetic enzyme